MPPDLDDVTAVRDEVRRHHLTNFRRRPGEMGDLKPS
jgi:hypothetical protein